MHRLAQCLLLVLIALIALHFLFVISSDSYARVTSLPNFKYHFSGGSYSELLSQTDNQLLPLPSSKLTVIPGVRKANATILMLARNTDVQGAVKSIEALEDTFNSHFQYPYVFLNDLPFTEEFKQQLSAVVSTTAEFGLIPEEDWNQPAWIDEERAAKARQDMVAHNVQYGGSVSYRNMCRFNSGFFYKHSLLQKYRWYWRVEPDVHFYCSLRNDPFLFMEDHNKTYGFTIAPYELPETIPSLWRHVQDFMQKHPNYPAQGNAMEFVSNDRGKSYNRCHCACVSFKRGAQTFPLAAVWSNFEIADMDFWRSAVYSDFFNYLDSAGGFYYERWGDAPVHSIAVSLFLPKDRIHFFEDIGYMHDGWTHCPLNLDIWKEGQCSCNQRDAFDYASPSCKRIWDRVSDRKSS